MTVAARAPGSKQTHAESVGLYECSEEFLRSRRTEKPAAVKHFGSWTALTTAEQQKPQKPVWSGVSRDAHEGSRLSRPNEPPKFLYSRGGSLPVRWRCVNKASLRA